MEEREKKSFLIYQDTENLIDMMTDEEVGILFRAIFAYTRTGEIQKLPRVIEMAFRTVRNYLDENARNWEKTKQARVEAGRASGRARAERAEQERTNSTNVQFVQQNEQSGTNRTVNVNENVSVNGNESVNESVGNSVTQETPTPSPSPAKTPRGKFGHVLLADRELERLQELRPNDWEAKLQRLDDYIEQTGRSYNNHLLTIMSWAEEDDKKVPRPADTSVHFAQETKNKGNYDGIFGDLFPEEADEYIKGGSQ